MLTYSGLAPAPRCVAERGVLEEDELIDDRVDGVDEDAVLDEVVEGVLDVDKLELVDEVDIVVVVLEVDVLDDL